MSDGQIASIVPGKTDRDVAAEIKREVEAALARVADILNGADREGFFVAYGIIRDNMGKNRAGPVAVMKTLA